MKEFVIKEHPTFELNIGGEAIPVSCYISLSDLEFFDESKDLESFEIIIGIIENHIGEEYKPDFSSISNSEIEEFINEYVGSEDSLKDYYDATTSENICDRFVETFQLYANDINKKMREILEPLQGAFKQFTVSKTAISYIEGPKIAVSKDLLKASESITRITRSMQSLYTSSIFEAMRGLSQSIVNSMPDYSAMVTGISRRLVDFAKTIKVPSLSEERKEALQVSYKTWGEYGWTIPPYATLSVFNEKPESLEAANKYMSKYTNASSMAGLFSDIRNLSGIRKDDIEEAIVDFNDKRLKSCTMILFGLIDAKILRTQGKEINRKSGAKGFKKVYDKMEPDLVERNAFFTLLHLINVYNALGVIFADGNNFQQQPQIMNRNFIDHGMLHGKVRRRDAVQVFLLLYNLVGLTDGWGHRYL